MTARELFDLIEGLPAEALCGTIRYSPNHLAWFRDGADKTQDMSGMFDAHAEALQRDAMTEWLHRKAQYLVPEYWHHGTHESWSITKDRRGESYPTRTHALAAACRYVSG